MSDYPPLKNTSYKIPYFFEGFPNTDKAPQLFWVLGYFVKRKESTIWIVFVITHLDNFQIIGQLLNRSGKYIKLHCSIIVRFSIDLEKK